MTTRRVIFLLVVLLAFGTPGFAAKGKPIAADHPFLKLLASTSLERGREHRALLVYPVSREAADPEKVKRAKTSAEAARDQNLSFGEPDKKEGRGPVDVFNWSTDTILLLAGEVLEGGHRDRFLSRDILLTPGTRVTAPALVADKKARKKDEAKKSLKPIDAVAPDMLRLIGVIDGPSAKAKAFLEDQFVMAGVKDPRRPLPKLFDAKLLQTRMADYRTVFAAIPDEAKKRTIGFVAMVGDRLVGIELFGSNAALRAHWPTLLKTLAHQAALYEAAYGILNQPFPAGKDPDRHVTKVKGLIKKLYAAKLTVEKPVAGGKEFLLSRDEIVGRLLVSEKDELIHGIFLADYITAAPDMPPPPGTTPNEYTRGELERRAERSRLTEYERRLLERMRDRNKPKGGGGVPKPDPEDVPKPGGK